MAVQNSEYFGILKLTPYNFSVAGNTNLHCGRSVRLPIITNSFIPLSKEDKIDALHIDCKTIHIKPIARSSREASLLALPNKDAIAFIGNPGSGFRLISPIRTLICDKSPCSARVATCLMSSVFRSSLDSPCKVPPPIPIPPDG